MSIKLLHYLKIYITDGICC